MAASDASTSRSAIRAGVKAPGRQVVLEIDDPRQPGLLEQRDAEHGTRVVPAQVLVVGEFACCRRILQHDALSRAEHVLENGLWQIIEASILVCRRSTVTPS